MASKLKTLFLLPLLFLPLTSQAAIATPWSATSTDKGSISPNLINGNSPWLVISGTGTSTFAGPLQATCFSTNGTNCIANISVPVSIANGGTATTSAVTNGVYYYNGTNAEADNTLVWTGTNFGIATSSPVNIFTVQGGTTNALEYGVGASSNVLSVTTKAGSLNGAVSLAPGNGGYQFSINGPDSTNNVSQMIFGSSALRTLQIANSGVGGLTTIFGNTARTNTGTGTNFVGINATSTPGALLAIQGSNNGTTNLFMLATSTGFASSTTLRIDSNGNETLWGSVTWPYLATPAGTFLAADPTGKVIATTTPSSGSGTVGAGTIGQMPYYAANGTTLTATSTLFLTGGSVGVGLTNPGARFEVEGTTTDATAVAADFWNSASTNLLRIRNDGNIGIGTTSPAFALNVASAATPQLALSDTSATANPWTFRSINGALYIATSSPSTFATSTSAVLSISTNGLLTSNNPFTLNGALTYGGVTLTNSVTGTGSMVLSIAPSFTGTVSIAGMIRGAAANNSSLILTGTTNASPTTANVTVQAANNANSIATTFTTTGVGIATTSPGAALGIQGNIFLAGNIVATSTATSTFAGGINITSGGLSLGSTVAGIVRATAGAITAGLVNLASDVTGILPIANGGTNASTKNGAQNNLGASSQIVASSSPIIIANTVTASTTVFTGTIPASALGTNGTLHLHIYLNGFSTQSASNDYFEFGYGNGTTTLALATGSTLNLDEGYVDYVLQEQGTTNSQSSYVTFFATTDGISATLTGAQSHKSGTSATDDTATQPLIVVFRQTGSTVGLISTILTTAEILRQ